MSKNTKRTLLGFVVAIAALLLIAYLPAETEAMSRAAWQYLGCFVFMLVLIISRAIPDWAAVLCTMAVLVALKVATVAEVTSNFASSTVWLRHDGRHAHRRVHHVDRHQQQRLYEAPGAVGADPLPRNLCRSGYRNAPFRRYHEPHHPFVHCKDFYDGSVCQPGM